MTFRKLVEAAGFSVILLLVVSGPSLGQEHEEESQETAAAHSEAEHDFHRNHFGGLVGVSTHHDTDDSGLTLGLEYVRVLSPKWAIGVYLELVSSDLERDVVTAIGGVYYPVRGLGLILALGLEGVEKDVVVHGNVESESELEPMIRVGVAYAVRLTPQAGIGPALLIDWAGDRWTTLVGVGMAVGFN